MTDNVAILNGFTQGFIEAAFASEWPRLFSEFVAKGMSEPEGHDDAVVPEFSDLAPETLARFMENCERVQRSKRAYRFTPEGGARFWADQQDGKMPVAFPPLRLYLADDGLIRIKEPA